MIRCWRRHTSAIAEPFSTLDLDPVCFVCVPPPRILSPLLGTVGIRCRSSTPTSDRNNSDTVRRPLRYSAASVDHEENDSGYNISSSVPLSAARHNKCVRSGSGTNRISVGLQLQIRKHTRVENLRQHIDKRIIPFLLIVVLLVSTKSF